MFSFNLTRKTTFILLSSAAVLAIGLFVWTLWNAHHRNGDFSFPLDDPWIHLQFAKNLDDYGSFSYFKNENVTSGSTAPLYTLLLAIGMFAIRNEFVLSYSIGILSALAAGWYLYLLSRELFHKYALLPMLATLIIFAESRMVYATLSGMETMFYIALLLAAFYYYRFRNGLALGLLLGAALWTRPETILFVIVLAADAHYHARIVKHPAQKKTEPRRDLVREYRWLIKTLAIFAVAAIVYGIFNYILSGALLPNTFSAKLKYYGRGTGTFLDDAVKFYTSRHMLLPAIGAVVGALSIIINLLKRKPQSLLVPFLWVSGLFFAYWYALPQLYQEGRYLMPSIPFFFLLSLYGCIVLADGAMTFFKSIAQNRKEIAGTLIVLAILLVELYYLPATVNNYGELCRYFRDRHIRTGLWLRDHLPADAVVATHDVGALAFYSQRKIVDMVGLVSPEMIENIGSFPRLQLFLANQRVTHIVTLRNWFEIGNQNPLFQTYELSPEIMEVFTYDPHTVHFVSQDVYRLTAAGLMQLARNNGQGAAVMLQQALQIDPNSARTYALLAGVYATFNQVPRAEELVARAFAIQPDNRQARFVRGSLLYLKKDTTEALRMMESLFEEDPENLYVNRFLSTMYTDLRQQDRADFFKKRVDSLQVRYAGMRLE